MSFYSIRKKELTDIADAIRAKTGKANGMTVEDMPKEIEEIRGGNRESAKASISVGVPDFGNIIIVDVPISVNTGFAKPSDVLRYYNRELLPEIPTYVSTEYPYLLIMRNFTTIRLVASTAKAYFHTADDGTFRITVPTTEKVNRFDVPNSTEWLPKGESTSVYFSVNGSGAWVVWWSNYDIPLDSPDGTDIFWHATDAQLQQPAETSQYFYNGKLLPKIPEGIGVEYPYIFIFAPSSGMPMLYAFSTIPYWYPTTAYPTCMKASGAGVQYKFSESENAWVFVKNHASMYGIFADGIAWANYNIPNGSETATTIYLYGTLVVPV